MPVSRDEFDGLSEKSLDLSEETDARKILSFLDRHADQAFTRAEIADATGLSDDRVDSILRRLEARRLVVHRGDHWAVDEHRVASLAGTSHGFEAVEERYPPEDMSEWGEYAVEPRE